MVTAKSTGKEVIQKVPPSTDGVENPSGGGKTSSDNEKEKEDGSNSPPEGSGKKSPPNNGGKRVPREKFPNGKKIVKPLFSFEDLVKSMQRGEVHALLEKHEMKGVPHRGIEINK
uniref:3',5'-cyclic-GMP phosphodiesterase n=1 Tax=Strongyloides papillosus TaxID=174720 RepID=A0A0N5B5W5_STREA